MSKIILKAEVRDVVGKKVKEGRGKGMIPAVVYGNKIASRNLWVSLLDFTKVYREAGENTIVELQIDGEKTVNALIHDIQLNPVSGSFTHADLFQVRMDEEIETNIPLEFVGESEAVKTLGGMLLKNVDEITVSCLPADLPHSITVDISSLATFDDHIKVGDLKVSSKVKVLSDAETIVAGVTPPRTEAEVAALEEKVEADVTKVEGVIKEAPATSEEK